jgi:hypothetical protein
MYALRILAVLGFLVVNWACPLSATAQVTADDFLPVVQGGSAAVKQPEKVAVSDKVVTAATAQDAINAAVQENKKKLKDNDAPEVGAKMVKFPSGLGFVASGLANYRTMENPVATRIAKRKAYVIAFTQAKKALAEKLQSQGIKSVAVDGQSLAAEIVTTKRMQENAKTLLQKAVGDFPLQFVEFVPSGKFVPNEKGGLDTTVEYRVNKERYRKYIAEVEKVLKPHAQESGVSSVVYTERCPYYDCRNLPLAIQFLRRQQANKEHLVMLGTTISDREGRLNADHWDIKEVTVHYYRLDGDAGPVALVAWARATNLALHCELQDSQGNVISEIVKHPCHDNADLVTYYDEADSLPGGPVAYNGETGINLLSRYTGTRAVLILPTIARKGMEIGNNVLRDTLKLPCHFDVSDEEIGRARKLVVTPSLPPLKNGEGKPAAKE